MNSAMKYTVGGVTLVLLLGGALAMGVAGQPSDALAAGLCVGGVDVGGLTAEQAQTKLRGAVKTPQIEPSINKRTKARPSGFSVPVANGLCR